MGLFFAFGKGVAHAINDSNAKRKNKQAVPAAYKAVNKQIEEAKKTGKRFNAKKAYREELRKRRNRIKRRHDFTQNFINSL